MIKILRTTSLPSGLNLQLIQGDITQVEADGIVNPANQNLIHGGGLAGLLASKAGPTMTQESRAWVKEHGPVSHTEPAYTTAGDLPFKNIIHAVGPVWGSGDEARKLTEAVTGSLQMADRLELESLALPAISTGIFGYPLSQAAEVILKALLSYARGNQPGTLNLISLVLYDDRAAAAFTTIWDQIQP
jgi:O-acetyl-ADP-ribose deacetylase (regulator of RNase III)